VKPNTKGMSNFHKIMKNGKKKKKKKKFKKKKENKDNMTPK
jgi:hypothetical protein